MEEGVCDEGMDAATTLGEFKILPPSNNGEVAGLIWSRAKASTVLARFVPRFFSLLLDCLMTRAGTPSLLDMFRL